MYQQLRDIGLSQSETKIYIALLRRGTATVRDLSKDTGLHRTNIYDVLEKLKEKGLVAFIKEGKKMHYKCSDPANLQNYLDQKQERLQLLLPQMQQLYQRAKEDIDITILKGKQGVISAYKEVLRSKSPVDIFGIGGNLLEELPLFRNQLLKQAELLGFPWRAIYAKPIDYGERNPPPSSFFERRIMKEVFESPIEVVLFADSVAQIIWEPQLRVILIKSQSFTESYRQHFELLWQASKAIL